MTEEALAQSSGCISKVVDSWRSLISTLQGHKIHPSESSGAKDCEFIVIDSKIRIRVIHISPGNVRKSQLPQARSEALANSKRSSLTEEYWFMKWNKPLKIGNCNCSFRRSLRYSVISNQPAVQNIDKKQESLLNAALPTTKITNVETFVECLLQETVFEAFQEYYMSLGNKETGKTNLAYETTEEDDVVVTLRTKFNGYVKSGINSHLISLSKADRSSVGDTKRTCVHKKVQKRRPLVILQHGIGASADIWYIIMNALVCRGFEVIAPDILGHGFSSAPNKSSYYTFNNLLLQALTIFDHYMTDEKRKCILIGHSYGCSLVTAMYPLRAQRIAQLILISGGGPTPLAPPVSENEIPPFGCVYTLLHPLIYCGLKRSFFYSSRGKHFQPCLPDSGLPSHVLENIGRGQRWLEGDAGFHRRILAPTLLVHGLQDTNVTLVQECEMERTIPRAFLELLPNAGHLSMLETPEHLVHMIMCFLDMWS